MKTRTTIFILFILLTVLVLIYWAYGQYNELKKWGEFNSLVKLWPRLQKEKIKSISFLAGPNPDTGKSDVIFEVPKENLQEFIGILFEKIKKVKPLPAWKGMIVCSQTGNMLVVTEKGRYEFNVHAHIGGATRSYVHGKQWTSYKLGEYLYKIGFPSPKYEYALPSKEQTQAIVLFSHCYDPPLCAPHAVFGDKILVDKLIYQGAKGEWEKTAGMSLEPKKVFEGRLWLEKIMDAYKEAYNQAEEKNQGKIRAYYPGDLRTFAGNILFITAEDSYREGITVSGNAAYDDYISSEQLKAYFDEIGLTEELLATEPNETQEN